MTIILTILGLVLTAGLCFGTFAGRLGVSILGFFALIHFAC